MRGARLFTGGGLGVPALAAPMTLPFLAQAKRIEAAGAVHGEYSVEMIDLVLQQLGERALGVNAVASSREVLVFHRDAMGSLYPNHEIRKREAVIPDEEVVIADIQDFRIDHREPFGVLDDQEHPDRRTDLRSGDAPAVPVALLPIAERVPQVVGHDPDRRGTRVVDRLAAGPQDRVPEESNAMNRHLPNLRLDRAGERHGR